MKRFGLLLGYAIVVYVASPTIQQCKSETPSAYASADPGIANPNRKDEVPVFRREMNFDEFDWMLFKSLSKRSSSNLLLSPISLKITLALLYEGAEDVYGNTTTASEIRKTLRLPSNPADIRKKFSAIIKSLQETSPDYKLNIGSRIFIDPKILIRQQYQENANSSYSTSVTSANFSDTHAFVKDVNAWVSNVTEGNIDKMIEDEDSVKNSLMLIMNALFFKGSWKHKYFSKESTKIEPFYLTNNRVVNVPFMQSENTFLYHDSEELKAQILRIPYNGDKFAMFFVLPRTRNGIEQLADKIDSNVLSKVVRQMREVKIPIAIPKFKFQFSSSLNSALQELGIRNIFDSTATLTNINHANQTSPALRVSNILQKAGIEVNENGTTAFVATLVELVDKIGGGSFSFRANHPFLFYIENEVKENGTILFMGKMMNPLNEPEDKANTYQESSVQSRANTSIADSPSNNELNAEYKETFFDQSFSKTLNDKYSGNLISSPASVKTALSILLEGADGKTKEEIASTLKLPSDESAAKDVIRRTMMALKRSDNGTEIDLATCLWLDDDLNVLDKFKETLSYYGGGVQMVHFTEPKSTLQRMKEWILNATRGKISLPVTSSIPPNMRLMLTAAVYFKGRWLQSFNKTKTQLQCFYTPSGECKKTYFMTQKSTYRYAHIPSIDADVLEIPYSDRKTVMLIIMPTQSRNDSNLQILSNNLVNISIPKILRSLQSIDATICLPKFTIEQTLNLMSTLQDMSIKSIFQSDANLTKIVPDTLLQVGSIVQNVKLEVDEQGTLGAANTDVGIQFLTLNDRPVLINRPFLFRIVDSESYTTLFSGRFMEPL